MSLLTGKHYIVVPRATTTERLALTPANGMLVYDTTLNALYKYENGAWSAFGGGSTYSRIVVSSSQTATNDSDYTLVASTTFTDPTPIEGKGYSVLIRNGTATIGALAYSTVGTLVWRLFHSGSWATYVLTNQTQLDLKQDKPITLNLSGDVTTSSNVSSAITGLVATLEANTNYIITGVLRSRCSGVGGVKYGMTLVSGGASTISAQGKGAVASGVIPLEEYYFTQAGTLTATALVRVAGGASDIYLNGNINVGATAGDIQFNFASGTNTQTSTIDQFGTWIEIKKVV